MTATNSSTQPKRGPLLKAADGANHIVQKILPDPFVIGALLIAVIFVWGVLATPTAPGAMLGYFGDGLWNLVGFAMQLSIVIVTSQALANTRPVARALTALAMVPRTPGQAALFVGLFTSALSFLNWGVGFVAGVILAREISRHLKGTHFPLLAAAAYAGYTIWSGGLSASIPLALNTPGHPLEADVGLIRLTDTIFTPLNLALFGALAITYALVSRLMTPPGAQAVGFPEDATSDLDDDELEMAEKTGSLAEFLERSRVLSVGLGGIGFVWFVVAVVSDGLNAMNLNLINLLILSLGLMLYPGVVAYLKAAKKAGPTIIPIVVIYPLYSAVSNMIMESGLGEVITSFFASFATADSLPIITFLTAGLINVFVPADGGHLVLQGPIFLELAGQTGVEQGTIVTAMSMGANWTNLLQPFWALPLLAIARLGIRDIMGYCLIMLIAGGIVGCLILGVLPLIF